MAGVPRAEWLDVTVPIRTGMVRWPDNPPVLLERTQDLARGDDANVSRLELGVHSGTHMDAPSHFISGGAGVDAIPLKATVGPARVVFVDDPVCIRAEHVARLKPFSGERLLFKTRNSSHVWKTDAFVKDFVYLSEAGAAALAEVGVRCVGIDYLSVASPENGAKTHRVLLEAGVVIVEGLDLSAVEPGPFEFICLPLRLENADGAPARAVLRPVSAGAG